MCGIAGAVESETLRVSDAALRSALNAVRHRGPDDDGVWTEGPVKFGHQRLAIVDLSSAGHQPMLSACGRYVLTYNGEIYNFGELRMELEARGRRSWRGCSDTEVLIEAISEYGIECALKKINGMFALAVWDRRENRLHLARDRFGEKPLFYLERDGAFAFASELGALEQLDSIPLSISESSLAHYFVRGYFPAPESIYEGVCKLPPGCMLAWRPGERSTVSQYWSLDDIVRRGRKLASFNRQAAIEELDTLLGRSVASRMVSDVPIGVFLSGGIDSSLIAAAMQRHASRPITTFTLGFDDPALNEAEHAREIAKHLGTDHVEATVTAQQALDTVSLLGRMYDEPLCDDSQLPTYLLSAMARKHVTVALAGDGGDELFGGYRRYVGTPALWKRMRQTPFREALGAVVSGVPASFLSKSLGFMKGFSDRYGKGAGVGPTLHRIAPWMTARSLTDLYERNLQKWPADATPVAGHARTEGAWPRSAAPVDGDLDLLCWHDQHNYLPGDILVKTDRASMAVSLETRLPLLDPEIAAFAWSLPTSERTGKKILKDVLERHVPASLFDRPKAGFTPPLETWLLGPLNGWANDLLSPERLRRQGILDEERVTSFWRKFSAGGTLEEARAWSLLMLQAWLEARGK